MGFEMFDLRRARVDLDERSGPLVRWRVGRFELNRPARDLLLRVAEVQSDVAMQRGAMLLFDYARRRVGVTAAPPECDPGLRQEVVTYRGPRVARSFLSDEWPLAVVGRDFAALYGIFMPRGSVRVEVEDQAEGQGPEGRVWGGPLLTFPVDLVDPVEAARVLRVQG